MNASLVCLNVTEMRNVSILTARTYVHVTRDSKEMVKYVMVRFLVLL